MTWHYAIGHVVNDLSKDSSDVSTGRSTLVPTQCDATGDQRRCCEDRRSRIQCDVSDRGE